MATMDMLAEVDAKDLAGELGGATPATAAMSARVAPVGDETQTGTGAQWAASRSIMRRVVKKANADAYGYGATGTATAMELLKPMRLASAFWGVDTTVMVHYRVHTGIWWARKLWWWPYVARALTFASISYFGYQLHTDSVELWANDTGTMITRLVTFHGIVLTATFTPLSGFYYTRSNAVVTLLAGMHVSPAQKKMLKTVFKVLAAAMVAVPIASAALMYSWMYFTSPEFAPVVAGDDIVQRRVLIGVATSFMFGSTVGGSMFVAYSHFILLYLEVCEVAKVLKTAPFSLHRMVNRHLLMKLRVREASRSLRYLLPGFTLPLSISIIAACLRFASAGGSDLYFIVHTLLDIMLVAFALTMPAVFVNARQRWFKDTISERMHNIPMTREHVRRPSAVMADEDSMGGADAPAGFRDDSGGVVLDATVDMSALSRLSARDDDFGRESTLEPPMQVLALLEYLEDSDSFLRFGSDRGVLLDIKTLSTIFSGAATVFLLVWQNSS